MSESTELALRLLRQAADTIERLSAVADADIDFPTAHGCAMNGGVRRLLVHNAEHDRMHAGAVSTARYTARQMQESELARLARDLLRERTELVGQLLRMDDALLDAKAPNDDWSIREHVEHVLYWEENSMTQVGAELSQRDGAGPDSAAGSQTEAAGG